MGAQFDILPFDETFGWGEVMEGERGGLFRRGGGRPMRAASAYRARPSRRPPPRATAGRWQRPGWPRPQWSRPQWPRVRGPRYPWYDWPGTFVAQPFPAPYEPAPWPEPDEPPMEPSMEPPVEPDEPGADFGGPEEEIPKQVRTAVSQMPQAIRPKYIQVKNLPNAPEDPRAKGPGLYLIVFQRDGRWMAYSGKSEDVARRLRQHRLCATMLGLPVTGHRVFVASMPASRLRDVELKLHTLLFTPPLRGALTNQRREMEMELLGPSWR